MSDELKQINEKISSVEDESLASTRRMKEMLCETKQTGVKAAEVFIYIYKYSFIF
jgi:hypothetical protein